MYNDRQNYEKITAHENEAVIKLLADDVNIYRDSKQISHLLHDALK